MTVAWDSLTPKDDETVELDGPLMILPGRGVRINAKTAGKPEVRERDLHARMYQAALRMCDAGAEGFSRTPVEGYLRLKGGSDELYVAGTTEREVMTTLGHAFLRATPANRDYLAQLGFRALVEWA